MRYAAKWPVYAEQWDRMVINPDRLHQFELEAKFAIANKPRYIEVQNKSGVLWFHVAVIHRRESDANFSSYLGNGQPLRRKTTQVPKGRGPFTGRLAFLDGCIDALRIDGLTSVNDWRLEKILYYCELFNGVGYDLHGRPSPYLWGGTNIQVRGKYIADHEWSSSEWDPQPGCAPLIATIAKIDPSITLVRET